MEEAGWQRRVGVNGKSEINRLFGEPLFATESYRGSAEQTRNIMPLLRWIAETVWLQLPEMANVAECFLQLCCCADALVLCDRSTGWSKLTDEQAKHQKLFAEIWPEHIRPKHHHRLHLGQQYQQLEFAVSCWGVEAGTPKL